MGKIEYLRPLVLIAFMIVLQPILLFSQNKLNRPIFIDTEQLQEIRVLFNENMNSTSSLKNKIDSMSNILLNMKPLSVMEKSVTPPSGDKHDFMSIGPYWWPDTSKLDGLPYIRRDGERNPEYYDIPDERYLAETIRAVENLTVLFYITRELKYASKAAELLRVWFIDEDTRMNPNLVYSQGIPGITSGRGIGIIESRFIFGITDAVILLRESGVWQNGDDEKLTKWFDDYFTWLTTHTYGIDESNEKNNHGTWYDVQAAAIAISLGKYDFAKNILSDVVQKRIEVQIDNEGKQPRELARTKSFSYSLMNLSAFMHLALLGDVVGLDLWNSVSASGGSIKKALDYLLPYAVDHGNWKYKQIDKFKTDAFLPMLLLAQKKYDEKLYGNWILKLFGNKISFYERIKKL